MRAPLLLSGSLLLVIFGTSSSAQPDAFDPERLQVSVVSFGAVSADHDRPQRRGYEVVVGGWAEDFGQVRAIELYGPDGPLIAFSPRPPDAEGYLEWHHPELLGAPERLRVVFKLERGVQAILEPEVALPFSMPQLEASALRQAHKL